MDASTWEAIGTIVVAVIALCGLFLPAIRRGNQRRTERRTDDVMWSGRGGVRGLPTIFPMWQRMETVENGLTELRGLVGLIDERTKELEPDGNGGHSMYDLLRRIAEERGIETGEPKA